MLRDINLGDWLKKSEILTMFELRGKKVDERTFRKMVKEHNKRFMNHEEEYFIAHSNKGYKATKDHDEILRSCRDKRKRALDMLTENARVLKALNENYNLRLIIDDNGIMVVES